MGCKARYGISNVCGDTLFPGGADADFWVGYVSDLSTRFSTAQTGPITTLAFSAYNGLRRFEGQKFANKFDSEYQKGTGGNGSFIHRGTVKLITHSTQDDVEIQSLLQAQDAFVIYKNNNDQFFILGASNGLTGMAGPVSSTGVASTDDVTDQVILEGVEKTKPLRFDPGTGTAAIVAYLNARVV